MSSSEQVLTRIPGLEGATIDAQLSDGPTNASFRVQHRSGKYVLRLDKPGAAKLGLNRASELEVYRVVAAAGLAPEPVYFEAAAGVFLRPWLEGRSWTTRDLESPASLGRLAALLRELHALPAAGRPFDPMAALRRYAARLDNKESSRTLGQAERLVRSIKKHPRTSVLCHNDLVCHNVLEGKGLFLIDWEYAGLGDPYFDLAVVVQHHGLDRSLEHLFLEAYLERPATAGERDHLELQSAFYACLLNLWNPVVASL